MDQISLSQQFGQPVVSIIIVHFNTPGLLKQTLKGVYRANIQVPFEIIVVDNNPEARIEDMVKEKFPGVKVILSNNVGFGRGNNKGMRAARGKYFLVLNPDIAVLDGAIEGLVDYLDQHPETGLVGPQLLNPNRSLQMSATRFPQPDVFVYRRSFFGKMPFAQQKINEYLMVDWSHNETDEVDSLFGACLLLRREAIEEVGMFDENFFMYLEDVDLCRRFWKAGWKVVYYPQAQMIHYHRRESSGGNVFRQLMKPVTRIHIQSAIFYFRKYRGEKNPRIKTRNRELKRDTGKHMISESTGPEPSN